MASHAERPVPERGIYSRRSSAGMAGRVTSPSSGRSSRPALPSASPTVRTSRPSRMRPAAGLRRDGRDPRARRAALRRRTVRRHGRDAGRLDRAECRDLGRSVPDDAVDLFLFAAGQAAFDATGGRGADMTWGGVG